MAVAYKLFRISKNSKGKLFPLYVNSQIETPLYEWISAVPGEIVNGKVKSRLGPLAYRPGWHLAEYPIATHIGVKENGKIKYMSPDHVWCICEYSDKIDYQNIADRNGINKNGIIIPKNAYLSFIPKNGFYHYKTNPNMTGEWIIAGEIKINKILSDQDVRKLLLQHNIAPMPRMNGDIDLQQYGLVS